MWRTLPKKIKREKPGHLQNEGWCNSRKIQEFSNLLKREGRKIIMRKESQDIRLPNLSRIFFNFVKFFYQYPFANSSRNIKNTFFSVHINEIDSLLEGKSIASNLNSNLDSTELSPVGGNTSGRKEGIFFIYICAYYSWINYNFFYLIGNLFKLSWHEVRTWCLFWCIQALLLSLLGSDDGSCPRSFPSCFDLSAWALRFAHFPVLPTVPP